MNFGTLSAHALALLAAMSCTKSIGGTSTSSFRPSSASPAFDIKLPKGYRDWKLVSVAHEEGNLNDLRAILANDVAITAYRQNRASFADGSVIARLAWTYVASQANNRAFGRTQSFVAGAPTDAYLQFMVKDSKRYPNTGGWGFAQFDKDGRPGSAAQMKTCFACHKAGNAKDFVFTHYVVR